jgi:hypothetical protein
VSWRAQYIVQTVYGDIEDFIQKSDSHNANGNVPNAYLNNNGKFNVNWNNINNSDSKYGVRSEVSHKNPRDHSRGFCV